ncbi:hypothetical protein WH47_00682 [Habropoda laboriosa]|uniref:Uncharacterized protein n=1 Tax=Habropoda laboriosa TaxID=597456 RepID=A0A0L7R482_9HYME|nr:hypothetical protein WH47_00682 [Habropoda laboriosa]
MSPELFGVTRAAYWQRRRPGTAASKIYRCKLERTDNEPPFNNAFDLNRNVMKIITSTGRRSN